MDDDEEEQDHVDAKDIKIGFKKRMSKLNKEEQLGKFDSNIQDSQEDMLAA